MSNQQCAQCGAEVAAGGQFCTECGTPVVNTVGVATDLGGFGCQTCGAAQVQDALFCPDCGSPYAATGPEVQPAIEVDPGPPPVVAPTVVSPTAVAPPVVPPVAPAQFGPPAVPPPPQPSQQIYQPVGPASAPQGRAWWVTTLIALGVALLTAGAFVASYLAVTHFLD